MQQKRLVYGFLCEYISGEPISDKNENSEAVFMDCDEALQRSDVTETAKMLINLARSCNPLPLEILTEDRVIMKTNNK